MSELGWLLFERVLFPAAISSLIAAAPFFGILLDAPILGAYLKSKILSLIKGFYDAGVVTIKVEMLDKLAEDAKRGYEPMIQMLREAQTKEFLSEEEELEYEKRLKDAVRSHPSVVRG